MPAKVIFTSNTHPVRSFMGAKINTFLLRGKNPKSPWVTKDVLGYISSNMQFNSRHTETN